MSTSEIETKPLADTFFHRRFDLDIDGLVDIDASPDVISKCTIDGILDEGCVLECVYLGDDACTEYIDIVQDVETVIVDITEPPTTGPAAGSTSAPVASPTRNENNNAGSNGDPHCK